MEEYPSNSHKVHEDNEPIKEKKVEKVISGTAKVRKKGCFDKLADVFISEDASNVKSYILMDVLIPSIKKAVSDIVTNGIDMILYGGQNPNRSRSTSGTRVSYRSYYDSGRREPERPRARIYSYDDVVLATRGEAEEVLASLDGMIDKYKIVSVADLYDFVGIQGSFTDNRYGWMDLSMAKIVHVSDGYLLKLPQPKPID